MEVVIKAQLIAALAATCQIQCHASGSCETGRNSALARSRANLQGAAKR
jgi:hypothetical protein